MLRNYSFSGTVSLCLSYYMAKMKAFRGLPGVVEQFGESSLVQYKCILTYLLYKRGQLFSGE